MREIFRSDSVLEPSEREFPRIVHRKILFLLRMNTTMMLRFDVVDLCHKNDERHRERTKLNPREIAHFPAIMIILNINHLIFPSLLLKPTFTSGFFRRKRRYRWNKSCTCQSNLTLIEYLNEHIRLRKDIERFI